MKLRVLGVACVCSIFACVAAAQTGKASEFVGVWRGQLDRLPAVDMVISDEEGVLSGGILFYLHRRQDPKSAYTSTPGLPEPMLALKIDGQMLDFKVSHRRAHPPGSLNDPSFPFRLKLIGPGRAELVNEHESGGPPLVMTRSDY